MPEFRAIGNGLIRFAGEEFVYAREHLGGKIAGERERFSSRQQRDLFSAGLNRKGMAEEHDRERERGQTHLSSLDGSEPRLKLKNQIAMIFPGNFFRQMEFDYVFARG